MRSRMHCAYRLAVLWVLSACAPSVVETIYCHGHEDGANELREFMRKELQALHASLSYDRARSYSQGYEDGVRVRFADSDTTRPAHRVM